MGTPYQTEILCWDQGRWIPIYKTRQPLEAGVDRFLTHLQVTEPISRQHEAERILFTVRGVRYRARPIASNYSEEFRIQLEDFLCEPHPTLSVLTEHQLQSWRIGLEMGAIEAPSLLHEISPYLSTRAGEEVQTILEQLTALTKRLAHPTRPDLAGFIASLDTIDVA